MESNIPKVDNTIKSTNELIQKKRTRKKTIYRKINDDVRKKLIDLVLLKNYYLKDAASLLDINFSTAKTILRVFRIEKRIRKKNDKKSDLKAKICDKKTKIGNYCKNTKIAKEINLQLLNHTTKPENSLDCNLMFLNSFELYLKAMKEINEKFTNCISNLHANEFVLKELLVLTNRITRKVERNADTKGSDIKGSIFDNSNSCPNCTPLCNPDIFSEYLMLKTLRYIYICLN